MLYKKYFMDFKWKKSSKTLKIVISNINTFLFPRIFFFFFFASWDIWFYFEIMKKRYSVSLGGYLLTSDENEKKHFPKGKRLKKFFEYLPVIWMCPLSQLCLRCNGNSNFLGSYPVSWDLTGSVFPCLQPSECLGMGLYIG